MHMEFTPPTFKTNPSCMTSQGSVLVLSTILLLLLWPGHRAMAEESGDNGTVLNRNGFPRGFLFGTASAAYQYEGGAAEGGRGPCIWDTFTHKHPEKIKDRSNGDMAIDSYHRYKEDVDIMKDMGFDAYRFSISWSRILPNGTRDGGINNDGIKYYNNLINYLLYKGLQPFVTLVHFDSPQALEDAYGGFLSQNIVLDFCNYAEICFQEFGDRVKHWITFNEPWSFCHLGYGSGALAPGRCSQCAVGDSSREPYAVGHNMLLAHATIVKLYREKYKASQKGLVGITLPSNWFIPFSKSKSDDDAVERALDFMYGWFMDPLTQGDYPFIMRALIGKRLPLFTKAQSDLIKGSFDFIGLNYYTSNYVSNVRFSHHVSASFLTDASTNMTVIRNGKPIGPTAGSSWLYVYPQGLKDLLLYTRNKYNNPIIYITENGVSEQNNETLSLDEALKDDMRIDYHKKHLQYIQQAIRQGADVRGYFVWSLMDNFEWVDGYTVRFGLNYVDYNDGLKRYPKRSAAWFCDLLK